jgi:AcrR family transcriptional regulator
MLPGPLVLSAFMGAGVKQRSGAAAAQPIADGRSERWREHRSNRRDQLVDAAVEALATHGPDVRMDQIAQVAGIAKPKLYRHFADRDDLIDAVAERVAGQIVSRLAGAVRGDASVREVVTSALGAYFALVDEQPNTFTFLIANTSPHGGRGNAIIEHARVVAGLFVSIASADLRAAEVPAAGAEPLAHSLIGAVLGATDWWLLQPVDARMPREQLVGGLATALLGAADATLRTVGLVLDPDAPALANHFRTTTGGS